MIRKQSSSLSSHQLSIFTSAQYLYISSVSSHLTVHMLYNIYTLCNRLSNMSQTFPDRPFVRSLWWRGKLPQPMSCSHIEPLLHVVFFVCLLQSPRSLQQPGDLPLLHWWRSDLLSTQRTTAELLDDSGAAGPTQTPVAARQRDAGLSYHAHHTVRCTACICAQNREVTIRR